MKLFATSVDRIGVGLLVVTLAAGCAHAETEDGRNGQTTVPASAAALTVQFPAAEVQRDSNTGQVERITGLTPAERVRAQAPDEIARTILAEPALATMLGLSPDLRELCEPMTRRDPQIPNSYVVRIQQCLGGVKVLGAEVVLNVRAGDNPSVASLVSSLVSDRPDTLVPTIGAVSADKIARAAMVATASTAQAPGVSAAPQPSPELVVFVPKHFGLAGSPRLTWLVRLGRYEFIIDAVQGSVLHQSATAVN